MLNVQLIVQKYYIVLHQMEKNQQTKINNNIQNHLVFVSLTYHHSFRYFKCLQWFHIRTCNEQKHVFFIVSFFSHSPTLMIKCVSNNCILYMFCITNNISNMSSIQSISFNSIRIGKYSCFKYSIIFSG
jgi:hypothetical protein